MLCCPGCGLTRRSFLSASAGMAAAGTLRRRAFAATDPAARWIDVHCHVFNAIDLPASEFIERTLLQGLDRDLAAVAVALLAGLYQIAAPTAQREIDWLTQHTATPVLTGTLPQQRQLHASAAEALQLR